MLEPALPLSARRGPVQSWPIFEKTREARAIIRRRVVRARRAALANSLALAAPLGRESSVPQLVGNANRQIPLPGVASGLSQPAPTLCGPGCARVRYPSPGVKPLRRGGRLRRRELAACRKAPTLTLPLVGGWGSSAGGVNDGWRVGSRSGWQM